VPRSGQGGVHALGRARRVLVQQARSGPGRQLGRRAGAAEGQRGLTGEVGDSIGVGDQQFAKDRLDPVGGEQLIQHGLGLLLIEPVERPGQRGGGLLER
jgi:hypothetical protein